MNAIVMMFMVVTHTIPHRVPFVVKTDFYVPKSCDMNDPMATCNGVKMTVMNPRRHDVSQHISCVTSTEKDEFDVLIKSGKSIDIQVELADRGDCYLGSFEDIRHKAK